MKINHENLLTRCVRTLTLVSATIGDSGMDATVNKLFNLAAAESRRLFDLSDLLTFCIVEIALGGDGVADDDCNDCMSLPFML